MSVHHGRAAVRKDVDRRDLYRRPRGHGRLLVADGPQLAHQRLQLPGIEHIKQLPAYSLLKQKPIDLLPVLGRGVHADLCHMGQDLRPQPPDVVRRLRSPNLRGLSPSPLPGG